MNPFTFQVTSKDFDVICDKIKSVFKNQEQVKVQHEAVADSKQKTNTCPPGKSIKNLSDLHLYRTDKSKRVFVPKSATSKNEESSFLSFSKDTGVDTMYRKIVPSKLGTKSPLMHKVSSGSLKPSSTPRYFEKVELLPLQVKRFQENPNKQKWKKSKNRSLENG